MPLSTIFILGILLILVIIIVIVLARTASFPYETGEVEPLELPQVDGESVAQRLGLAIQLKTFSSPKLDEIDPVPFRGLHNLIHTLYPMIEEHLDRETVNEYGLLYTWQGSDPSLQPVCFMAHQDVVPADESENSGWKYPPFSGTVAEGFVWGRGAIDCKGILISLLESVNNLLKENYQPLRTIYLAFGFDEENSGLNGAGLVAKKLQNEGVKLSFLLDEGGVITTDLLKDVDNPVAAVGISEKGYMTLRLKAKTAPGHASMPPQRTAVGSLALAIATLEANPFPQNFGVLQFMMSHLGKALPFVQRMALANTWLFGGLLRKQVNSNPTLNAITRTTVAPTMINGGQTDNVLPAEAEAKLNFRIMDGETREEVFQRVTDMVGDEIISVLPGNGESLKEDRSWNPAPASDVDSAQYTLLENLIMAAYPGTLVMPTMFTAGTDARYFSQISNNIYRFAPFVLSSEEIGTTHGINERLSIANCAKSVGFHMTLMRLVSSLTAQEDANFGLDEGEEESVRESKPAPERKAAHPRQARAADPEQAMIDEMNAPLPTKPMKQPPAQSVAYPDDPLTLEELQSATPSPAPASSTEPLPAAAFDMEALPEDDEPLVVKPMKKA